MKILVVTAHRGDAALSLGLGIGTWLAAGHSVAVLNCFTRSADAPFSDAGSLHPNDRMSFVSAVRKREDEAWAKLYPKVTYPGKLTFNELNLKDAPLRLHIEPAQVYGLQPDPTEKATLKIEKAVQTSGAEVLIAPLALARHIDHTTARDATVRGLASDLSVALYEDMPQALKMTEDSIEAIAHEISLGLRMNFGATYPLPPLSEVEQQVAVDRKRRLAWCYDSILDEETTLHIAKFCLRYQGRERLWGNAAWRNCGLAVEE
jgi:LmbE family N-acetylglucosaminyl deacetylase